MNIKAQITGLAHILFFRKWRNLYLLILICVFSKFQAVSHDVRSESIPEENTIYVIKGTVVYNPDGNIRIKQIPEPGKKEKTTARFTRKKEIKNRKLSGKTELRNPEQARNAPTVYSKNSSSGNGLSVQARNEIVFVSAAGDTQIKSAVLKWDGLYISGYRHETYIVRRRFEDLFLKPHFSESHAIRPPPFCC